MKKICIVLWAVLFAVSLIAQPPSKHSATTMYPSYKSLIMAGYQGWFHSPKEGQLLYPDPTKLSIDMWPDVSEYEKTYETGLMHADGIQGPLFQR